MTPQRFKVLHTGSFPIREKVYLVIPGYINSSRDGQRHWINAEMLRSLYGVAHYECFSARDEAHAEEIDRHWLAQGKSNLIRLKPRYDGKYIIPGSELDSKKEDDR